MRKSYLKYLLCSVFSIVFVVIVARSEFFPQDFAGGNLTVMMLHAFLNCFILYCATMDIQVWQRFLSLSLAIPTFYFQFSLGMLTIISVVIVNGPAIVVRRKGVRR